MKKAFALSVIITLTFQLSAVGVLAAPMSDIADNKFKTAIEYLQGKNIINGYDDGTFRPDNTINRAELLKILVGGAGYAKPDEATYRNCFPDVKTEWYASYVCFAKEKGWINGYSDGSFRPEQMINKVEAIKMLVNSQGYPATKDTSTDISTYSDVDLKQWYGPYMYVAEAMEIIENSENNFYPDVFITRGEVSNNIYRSMLIIENKVGSFSQVPNVKAPSTDVIVNPPAPINPPVVNPTTPVNPPVVNPPATKIPFDAPGLTVKSTNPKAILLTFSAPVQSGDSSINTYTLKKKKENDLNYTSSDYTVEYYNAKEKSDGGITFVSSPSTMYHFRVKASNSSGQTSGYSTVKTMTTAAPLEPAAPTVTIVSQTYKNIELAVKLPTYTGDSALDMVSSSFTDPNDGSGQGGSVSIEGNNIGATWNAKFLLSPKITDTTPPTYTFEFWVNNKNGKLSEKTIFSTPGLSANPGRPTVTVKSIAKNEIDFDMKPPSYSGSSPIKAYGYLIESSSSPNDSLTGGEFSKNYFETEMKNVMSVGAMLVPNTTYVISFWVVNFDGKKSGKVTMTVKTSAN